MNRLQEIKQIIEEAATLGNPVLVRSEALLDLIETARRGEPVGPKTVIECEQYF